MDSSTFLNQTVISNNNNSDHKLEEDNMNSQSVAHMFDGRSVFVTGASGFIGRVLLEKLLRCYTGIKRIYILLRTKKNVSPSERLHKSILSAPIFDRVRSMEAKDAACKLFDKIVVVSGDISEPQLGISDSDMEMLLDDETLSIVFHSAATIKFDEPLKVSVQLNLIATKTIIEFSRKLKNLVSLCHVSTAYVNSHLPETELIEERLYPMSQTPEQVINLAQNLDESMMQLLKPALVANRPNTYTYTKALAEHLITSEAADLPVAIVRPSIVVASWREPVRGWIDNINGPTGLLLAISKGLLRTMYVVRSCKAEIIPVDVVVNTMVASAFYAAKINNKLGAGSASGVAVEQKKSPCKDANGSKSCNGSSSAKDQTRTPPIFHCNSGNLKPIKWEDMEEMVLPIVRHYPSVETYRYPFGTFKNNKYHNLLTQFFVHFLPALILDLICGLMGKKRRLMWIYGKLNAATAALSHFTSNEYNFQTKNIQLLRDTLTDEVDQKELFMDIENIPWLLFWNDYVLGCRRYLLKEDDSTLEVARQNAKRAWLIEMCLRSILLLLVGLCLTPIISRLVRV